VRKPLPGKISYRFSVLLSAALLTTTVQAQQAAPVPAAGEVQPAVAILADASQTYALYLPSKYSPQKRWPLLLAFDPSGEGLYPVKLFQPAAEKYGYIVIGSNNTRNFVDPSTAIRLLFHDVTTRYAIDPRRIYTTGFSGGSRVAAGVAIACKNCIAGVISCGAGLPTGSNVPPPETADWFLAAGTIDFNYSEITHLDDALTARHAATHLAYFPGPHHWMSPAVAEEALAWMQLRAMVKGITPLDRDFVESEFAREVNAAKSLQQSGDALTAFRRYREIINDFHFLRDVKELQAEQSLLASSNQLKRARKNEQALFDLETKTVTSINDITNAVINKQQAPGVLYQSLESLMSDIRRDRDTAHDQAHKNAILRAMAGAFAYARETGSDDLLKKDYLQARDLFRITAILRPEAAWPHYLTAQALAELGDNKTALDELNKAVALGLNNPELLDSPEFEKLRTNLAFKDIQTRIAKNAPPQTEN
jgi:dienelactone hydrolase